MKLMNENLNIDNISVFVLSVSKIQRFWRSYIDKQIFKYYCKLINFKNQGDPLLLLKCINPKEIDLFDPAFGAFVKFRLGGVTFPPNIYYKIYTHRPIQDLCASSPKNYNQIRLKDPRCIHNKYQADVSSRNGWYQRIENNGWRPISDKVVSKIISDPISYESSMKPVKFDFDQRQKLENKRNKTKKRKLEWLKKMYNQNLVRAKCDPIINLNGVIDMNKDSIMNTSEDLVRKAAESMIETYELKGEVCVEDWAVDELLNWTTGLTYNIYLNDWGVLATSLPSDWKLGIEENKSHMKFK